MSGIWPATNRWGLYFVIAMVVIWIFGEILIFPNLAAFISRRASDDNLGKYMGMYSFSFSLAFALAPTIGGYVYGIFSPSVLWFSIGIFGVLIGVGFLLTEKTIEGNNAELLDQ